MKNKWIASLTASFFLTLSLSATALNQSPAPDVLPPIIPKPAQIQSAPGAFNISPNTPVICAQEIVETAKLAAAELGLKNVSVAEPADKAVNLRVNQSLQPEAYRLEITPARITVAGGSPTGV
jgi:N-acetyl-beta-hexosaminidase